MNKKSIYLKLLSVLLCTTILSACGNKAAVTDKAQVAGTTVMTSISDLVTYDANDYYTEWKNETQNYIKLNDTGATLEGTGATVEDSKITITAAGVYVISGKLADGQIIVDVEDKGTVKLVLNGAEIYCSNNAPIYVKAAEKTVISLEGGTENIISDGEKYVFSDASTDEPNAAIYSKDDLTINGTGKLIVHGNYNNGITSKDDLKITGGDIKILSTDDGLMGKDIVAVKAGTISIEAGGDGIKSSNDTDAAKGSVALEGGTFNIKSEADGIQATTNIFISGGSFKIDSADDALHSNKNLTITSGDFSIATGDDGIHADEELQIKDGKINITKSYEGLESNIITLSGGEINIISTDDGINAAAGSTEAAETKGAPGKSTGTSKLNINGGNITVDASGDGLDSNGSIIMTKGTVIVSGPTTSGNGTLDYDGTFVISGGLLMAAGSSGMAQATSEESTQNSIIMTYTETQKAGTVAHIEDSKGTVVGTLTPKKDYQTIVVSSPELVKDATYTLYSGGTKVVEFTVTNSVTWLNETGVTTSKSSNQGGPNQGGQGNPGGRVQRDPTAMNAAYSTVLKALVSDKTITQAQSDKVLVAVTENMNAGRGGTRPDDNGQVDGAKPKNDSLSELVTSKVITESQADTINQKLQEAMISLQNTTPK